MMKLSPPTEKFSVDVGKADLYIGEQYPIPYFFEHSGKKMMKEMSDETLDFKTWKGEFFQLSLDSFHSNKSVLITSTLGDCAFIPVARLSIDKSIDWAERQSENKHNINGSFSGYFTFGKRLLHQYEDLKKHLDEQEIYFSDEAIVKCYKELCRRIKHE